MFFLNTSLNVKANKTAQIKEKKPIKQSIR